MFLIWIPITIVVFIFLAFAIHYLFEEKNKGKAVACCAVGIVLMAIGSWVGPQYKVWKLSLDGKAQLEEAKYSKMVAIEEALAEKESAEHIATAEIIRAGGVAEANEIIADSLGGADGYLKWRYIEMLEKTGDAGRETIYIPTNGLLPQTEATRLMRNK